MNRAIPQFFNPNRASTLMTRYIYPTNQKLETELMNQSFNQPTTIWFIYDGDCPICTSAAQALRIKAHFGDLKVLNAREPHPLVEEVNRRRFDLDEGMVIYDGESFYHGPEALRFMAKYGEAQNAFMGFTKLFYWSDTLAKLTYPWMRGVRNWLISRSGFAPIDNLNYGADPIFATVFGQHWHELPLALKKHYQNRPFSQERIRVTGHLNVRTAKPFRWLAPIAKLLGQIPLANAKDVPVTVDFLSAPRERTLGFHRQFYFHPSRPYHFKSRMTPQKNGQVFERMAGGFCWRLRYEWDQDRIKMHHVGYGLHWFGHLIPLPITWIFGAGYAEEWAIDDNSFAMKTYITHPWWGEIYRYSGEFHFSDSPSY